MVDSPNTPSLSEAFTRFVASRKNEKKPADGHQELSRFVAWCGRDRRVDELSPSEVADYASHVGTVRSDSAQRLSSVKVFLSFLKEEGWVQTGLAAHLRVPRTRRNGSRRNNANHSGGSRDAYLSQEGYDRLASQLEELKQERVKVVEDIKNAMADKDFRENAPLDAAKERQGIIESKIRELEAGLSSAKILEEGQVSDQRVTLGTKVTLKDVESGRQVLYTLVDVREANVSQGKISTASPVGQALLDRTVGDEVAISVPKGTLHYVIEDISD